MAKAYCFKCRTKVDLMNPITVILKNKRLATKGICPQCGAKVFRIGEVPKNDLLGLTTVR